MSLAENITVGYARVASHDKHRSFGHFSRKYLYNSISLSPSHFDVVSRTLQTVNHGKKNTEN